MRYMFTFCVISPCAACLDPCVETRKMDENTYLITRSPQPGDFDDATTIVISITFVDTVRKVDTVASYETLPLVEWLNPGGLSMLSLHVHYVTAWVFSGLSEFLHSPKARITNH